MGIMELGIGEGVPGAGMHLLGRRKVTFPMS